LQTKSDFETKTAAINVTPTPNGKYDIKTIKEDALWLSKTVSLNEIAALRIVVVEFQSRAQSFLTGPLSTQDVVNIQDSAGTTGSQATSILASIDMSSVADAEDLSKRFEEEGSRRQRFVTIYLLERRCFMTSADYITNILTREVQEKRYRFNEDSYVALSDGVVRGMIGPGAPRTLDALSFLSLLSTYLEYVPSCIQRGSQPLDSTIQDSKLRTEENELDWVETCLTEAVHALALIFQLLDLSSRLLSTSPIISGWFKFMDEVRFLDDLPEV